MLALLLATLCSPTAPPAGPTPTWQPMLAPAVVVRTEALPFAAETGPDASQTEQAPAVQPEGTTPAPAPAKAPTPTLRKAKVKPASAPKRPRP